MERKTEVTTVKHGPDESRATAFPRQIKPNGEPQLRFLFILAVLTTISPFATDMYLPALPLIVKELNSDAPAVQLTLAAFLLGIALGQLVFGPLADKFGRRKPLIAGTALCLIASVAATCAPTVEFLIGARLLQGFAGAAGIVIGRAVVADLFRGVAAARAFSLLAVVGGLAPILAPLFGGLLVEPIGWRGIFGVLLGLTVAMLLISIFAIPETNQHTNTSAVRITDGLRLLRIRGFANYTLLKFFVFVVLMGYIAASPFVFQNILGVSPLVSGLLFGLNSVGMILANSINAWLVKSQGPRKLLRVGLTIMSLGAVSLAVLVITPAPVFLYPVPLFFIIGALGFVNGNSVALAMDQARHAAGTGSAFIGCAQFFGGAAVAPLMGIAGEQSMMPLVLVTLVATFAANIFYFLAKERPSTAVG